MASRPRDTTVADKRRLKRPVGSIDNRFDALPGQCWGITRGVPALSEKAVDAAGKQGR
jgi:hypothetical protein